MISAADIVDDVQGEFEGGNSLSVNWNTLLTRAMENVNDNCRPDTLKRRVRIYGGVGKDLLLYFAPTDILVPSFLYPNTGLPVSPGGAKRKLEYVPNSHFYRKLDTNTFTIEDVNGARFIVTLHEEVPGSLLIDNMDALGTKTGGSAALNEHNFLYGSGAVVEATFTDAGVTLSDTLSATIDISDYLKGILLLPTYIPTADNISSIVIRLLSSAGNYYQVTTAVDNISDYLIDGWNQLYFDMNNATTTGSPDKTKIASWEIIGTTTSGKTETLIFDSFSIQKTNPFHLDYYSNAPFVNSSGVKWQTTVEYTTDKVNINRDVRGILHYELCVLVTQSATFDKVDSQASKRFEGQLQRKYQAYYDSHPSAEQPHSYSKSPEIDISSDRGIEDIL